MRRTRRTDFEESDDDVDVEANAQNEQPTLAQTQTHARAQTPTINSTLQQQRQFPPAVAPSSNGSANDQRQQSQSTSAAPSDIDTSALTAMPSPTTLPTQQGDLSDSSLAHHSHSSLHIQDRRLSYRESQFSKTLHATVVKLPELRKLAWNGIPPENRAMTWKLLLGYLPTNQARRNQTLQRKRAEYKDAMKQHYDIDDNSRTLQEQETLRQVLVDVPRTAPEVLLFRNERIRRALARLLYIWAMRHPASSYVQGINDLATPLFVVFLSDYYNGQDVLDGNVMVVLPDPRLDEVEADVYWCLTNILAGIQDHYTADQPGVQRMVMRLEELVRRIDGHLCRHLESVGIQFMQFAFKWMNCLLLREFNLRCVVRLWDTYLSEDNNTGFEDFHVYVCAAFLCQFSAQLQTMDFDELFGFMQQVPTDDWGETEIEMLLSQAYVLSTLFGGSVAHLNASSPLPVSHNQLAS